MPRYQDFIDWIVNYDDTSFLNDNNPIPSVTISMLSHVFNKPVETVIEDVRRRLDSTDQIVALIDNLQKIGFKKLKLQSGNDYRDLLHMSYTLNSYLIHFTVWKFKNGFKTFVTFYKNGHDITDRSKWEYESTTLDYDKIVNLFTDAVRFVKQR